MSEVKILAECEKFVLWRNDLRGEYGLAYNGRDWVSNAEGSLFSVLEAASRDFGSDVCDVLLADMAERVS